MNSKSYKVRTWSWEEGGMGNLRVELKKGSEGWI